MYLKNKQKSPYSKKGGNHLLFSVLESKCGRLHEPATEEQTTTSAQLKVTLVKEVDSSVRLVMYPKKTCDVGEFLKHCD